MGYSAWSPSDWATYSSSTVGKSTDKIYTSRSMIDRLDPKGVTRESRDSDAHPLSTPIIVGLDVTGSMGMLADTMAREGLGVMIEEILKRKPVVDPQTMIMAIGDVECDAAPLQVTQFESGNELVEQLTDIYIERGGGGNGYESYTAAWYFAAMHTSTDAFEKRGKKGYLFTVGDEPITRILRREHILKFIGDEVQQDFSPQDLLTMVNRMYNVFHIVVEEGNHFSNWPDSVINTWLPVLGQRMIRLSDHKALAEVVVSTIEVNEGRDRDEVASSWSGSTSVAVKKAIGSLSPLSAAATGVVRL